MASFLISDDGGLPMWFVYVIVDEKEEGKGSKRTNFGGDGLSRVE